MSRPNAVNAQFLLKATITVVTVLVASCLAKRQGWLGALVASLPLTSLLVLVWMHAETRDANRVATLSLDIFWFVLGGLPFFAVLTLTLRHGWGFGAALAVAILAGFIGVSAMQWLITHLASRG